MIQLFNKDLVNKITFIAALGGTVVTGLTDADFTVYVTVEGAAPSPVTITGLVTELDAVNTPGLYTIALPASAFATQGYAFFYITGALFDSVVLKGNIGLMDFILDIRAMSGQIGTSITSPVYDGAGNLTTGTLNGFNPNGNPSVDTPRVSASISATYNADGTMASFKVTEV